MSALPGRLDVGRDRDRKEQAPAIHIIPTRFEDALDFRQRERSPLGFTTGFERLHTHRRIHRQQSLPDRFTETDPLHLGADVCGGARQFPRFAVSEPGNVVRVQCL